MSKVGEVLARMRLFDGMSEEDLQQVEKLVFVNRFNSGTCLGGGAPPCFAPYSLVGAGEVIADASSPATNDAYTITNKVSIDGATQQAGKYQTTVLYSAYATY